MIRYDVRCGVCNVETVRAASYAGYKAGEVEKEPCECGGTVSIIVKAVNLSSDATPTRGFGRSSKAPALVGQDGKPVNLGHTPVTASMIGLKPHQAEALGL